MAKTQLPPKAFDENNIKIDRNHSQLINDIAALTYYQVHGSKIKFESLPESEQHSWYSMSAGMLISLDKLNKTIVQKVEAVDVESNHHKNVQKLTAIIDEFVRGIQTLRCPKCGSTASSRAALFPSLELAHRIWEGG